MLLIGIVDRALDDKWIDLVLNNHCAWFFEYFFDVPPNLQSH
jgi:hypothetical protein